MHQTDHLIIGQGITGSVLALALIRKGKSVVVIDKPQLSSCSKVATGSFNPFNFRVMMNNWRAKEMSDAMFSLYRYAEKISGEKLITERKLYKIFTSEEEKALWKKACAEKENLFASNEILEHSDAELIDAPFGMGMVNGAGNVDCGMLMHIVKEKLKAEGNYFEETFEESQLEIKSDSVIYAGMAEAKHITFCQGHLGRKNSYFASLPIRPVKGEVLHVHIPGLKTMNTYSRGVSLVPLGNELFIISSTYRNNEEDEIPSERSREELLNKAKKFIRGEIEIVSQYAGVRPAVQDRRTLVGIHPKYPRLSTLNGMGSKALFLSPWLSEQLIDLIYDGKALPDEVNITRFM